MDRDQDNTDNFDKDDDDNYDASWSTSEPSCSLHLASVLIIVLVSGSRLTLGNPSSMQTNACIDRYKCMEVNVTNMDSSD